MELATIWWNGLYLTGALIDPVRLADPQVLLGDLRRQPVTQDLTHRVVDGRT